MDRLKSMPISALKGSDRILNRLQAQREAAGQRKKETFGAGGTKSEMNGIIAKQQNLVMELNCENVKLIGDNEKLREHLEVADWDRPTQSSRALHPLEIVDFDDAICKCLRVPLRGPLRAHEPEICA